MSLNEFLIKNQGKGQLSWKQVAKQFSTTPDAARMRWKRILEDTPTEESYLRMPVWKTLDSITKEVKQLSPQAKVLIFDTETAPMLAHVWRIWQQNISPVNGQLYHDIFLLSWSAKWLFSDTVINMKITPEEVVKQDDERITRGLWKLIDEADIIIAHNALNYDVKVMNSRFLVHGLPPTSKYQVIDTLKHAKRKFRLASNKLDYLGLILLGKRKMDTGGFDLWKRCYNGDVEAIQKMSDYCDEDVRLLEAVYLKMRPWITPHPNLNLFMKTNNNCPSCASTKLTKLSDYKTYANSYESFRCDNCSAVSKKAKNKDRLNSI